MYDNAGNLQYSCLNKDSGFCSKTKFIVDRRHWFYHKGKFVEKANIHVHYCS
jgi:hypothetical protein